MNFNRLTIHNLASIGHAEIDFTEGVLAEEPLFLICGETGAGKSTILDAVCLALYKDTPRLSGSSGPKIEMQEGQDVLGIRDTRQLMRKNTAEAFARLEFDGSDGDNYVAEWRVRRARGRVDGNIMKEEWSLENRSSRHVFTAVKEIREEIYRAVGLTFDQFCRTTMLAQGEFTRFLKSDEKEKSDILEKLTGTERFSEIGRKIHMVKNEKGNAVDCLNARLQGVVILSEEEVREKKKAVTAVEESRKELGEKKKAVSAARDWLKDKEEKKKKYDEAASCLDAAQKAADSEECRAIRKNLKDWKKLDKVRGSYGNIIRERAALAENNVLKSGLYEKCLQLLGRNVHVRGKADRLEMRLKKAAEYFAGIEPLRPMLERGETVAEKLRSVMSEEDKAAEAAVKAERYGRELPALESERKELERKTALLRKKSDVLKSDIDVLSAEIGKMDKAGNGLRSRKLNEIRPNVAKTVAMAASLGQTAGQLAEENRHLGELEHELADLEARKPAMEKKCAEAEEIYRKESAELEKLKMAVEDWAREARLKLKQGDRCPVCGKIVDEVLSEESFSSVLAANESDTEAARQGAEDVRNELNRVNSEIKVKRPELERCKEAFERKKSVYSSEYGNLLVAVKDIGIKIKLLSAADATSGSEGHCGQVISRLWSGMQLRNVMSREKALSGESISPQEIGMVMGEVEKELLKEQKRVQDILDMIEAKEKEADSLKKNKETLDAGVQDAKDKMAGKDKTIASIKATMEELQKTADSSARSAAAMLDGMEAEVLVPGWREKWKGGRRQELIDGILEDSKSYRSALNARDKFEADFKSLNDMLEKINSSAESVSRICPDWDLSVSSVRTPAPVFAQDMAPAHVPVPADSGCAGEKEDGTSLVALWVDLRDEVFGISQKIGENGRRIRTAQNELDGFFAAHPEIDRKWAEEFMGSMNDDKIAGMEERLGQVDGELQKAKVKYSEAVAALRNTEEAQSSLEIRPQDGDTVETFDRMAAGLEAEIAEENRKKGEIEGVLKANERALSSRKGILEELEAARKEYGRWNELAGMFGSADGARFRKIAQGFILKQLLDGANGYLRLFSPRYELDCPPGTLNIVIHDLYQGDAIRPYSTLSGGESFIVSLALALGLSSVGGGNASAGILFIDEGFGTLSEDYLNTVMNTLSRLHEDGGKKVGIISHVDLLRERIPAQIRLVRQNNTLSKAEIVRA